MSRGKGQQAPEAGGGPVLQSCLGWQVGGGDGGEAKSPGKAEGRAGHRAVTQAHLGQVSQHPAREVGLTVFQQGALPRSLPVKPPGPQLPWLECGLLNQATSLQTIGGAHYRTRATGSFSPPYQPGQRLPPVLGLGR